MHLSEYLACVCPENVGEDSKWLEECKSQLEPKIKQALSQWNSISRDQKQLNHFLRTCDGLWSDRYGDSTSENTANGMESSKSSSPSWSLEGDSWFRIISVLWAAESRLFVLIEMPRNWFVESDILHWRYHDKRKIFLAILGCCLVQSGQLDNVHMIPWAVGKPMLQLRLDKQLDIVLIPCLPRDVFQSRKIFKGVLCNSHSEYYYKTTIWEDMWLEPVFQVVEQVVSEWKRVISFLERWYRRWHMKNGFGISEDVFLMSIYFMIHMMVKEDNRHWKRLDFRRLVEYFFHRLESQVKNILDGQESQPTLPLVYLCPCIDFIPTQSWQLDSVGMYGELYHLWRGIQYTIRCFDMSSQSMGDWMLCTAFPLKDTYSDHCLLGQWDMFLSLQFSVGEDWKVLDYLSFYANCYRILYHALWKRCVYLSLVQQTIRGSICYVVWGCRLRPKEESFGLVEKATTEIEKQHFCTFWKEKCELRRYRDGNVYESVVWKQSEEENEIPLHVIFHRICHYALAREMPFVQGEQIQIFCDDWLETFLPSTFYNRCSSSSLPWVTGLDKLVTWLGKLDDLPFQIHNICVVDDMFRGTSVILPDVWMNQAIFQYMDAPQAILVVENSMQWPKNDREAQKMMRIGYYLSLKKCLQDHGMEASADERGLDVVFEDYIYHFEIWMHQEYQQAWINEYRETAIGIQLHYHLKYMTEKETNSFAVSCRLAKRWLSCHMFSDYFSNEVIELLVARAYVYEMGSLDGDIPSCGLSGFYHFLYVLSLFATQKTTVVVPIPDRDDLPHFGHSVFKYIEDLDQLSNIYAQQQAYPFYWKLHDRFLYPLYQSARGIPEWPVLKRIGQVAKATYKTLESRIMSPDKWNVDWFKILFRPDFSVYDIVIVMHRKYLSRVERYSLASRRKKYPSAKSIPLDDLYVNIDPLEYFVQQLRDKFGTFALFFYDKYGGYQIGVLWKPVTRTFSLSHMPFMKPENGQWQVNYNEILHNIRQMGGKWIKQIRHQTPTETKPH